MPPDGGREGRGGHGKLVALGRWLCAPYESGWGREFCKETCSDGCAAQQAADAEGRTLNPSDCSAKCPRVFRANAIALRCFEAAIWQFSSSGFGDATFPGSYAQTMLDDLGIRGPERVDQLERIRILDDARRKADAIRMKRKKRDEKPD